MYGQNPGLRAALEEDTISYVMAVPCSEPVTVPADLVPAGAWQRLSCADGSKEPRLDDWVLVDVTSTDRKPLVRRSCTLVRKALKFAFFWCYAPHSTTMPKLAPSRRGTLGG